MNLLTPLPLPLVTLVGFTGGTHSGKDTCAMLLHNHGYARLAFADPLKRELCAAFGVDLSFFTDPWYKERDEPALALERCADGLFVALMRAEGHDVGVPRSPRWLMQRWGTEYRLQQNPVYWTDVVAMQISQRRAVDPHARIAITDVRLPHERELLHSLGGCLLRVHRTGGHWCPLAPELASHTSELPLAVVDDVVHNDGDFEHLRYELLRVLHAQAQTRG